MKKSKDKKLFFQFWGVRGSIPTPGQNTIKYGGNTSCIEVRCGDELIIFDGGSGLRLLGLKLLKEPSVTASIFFTHFHWDHIQGFPFFTPAFLKGNLFKIYGDSKLSKTIEDAIGGQMAQPTFPVSLKDMESTLKFKSITAGSKIKVGGDVVVSSAKLNHPGGALAYKVSYNGKNLVYVTDHEHGTLLDRGLIRHCQNADVMLYDATYTDNEYEGKIGPSKKGWGHSTWTEGIKIAKAANVKKFFIFHHDPAHSDNFIEEIEAEAKKLFAGALAAKEGFSMKI